ncbi:hypothetical protein NQ176_g5852 [Zarea fungicola]|uniref:Uncharacterized protein n=1 Tax=Zarea fungicola TaxID=93591 RepID=A0ACC1N8Q2_9HYPO|nr:hypothetical protein NQ176_g5852 [Lecanicillium fungicola]
MSNTVAGKRTRASAANNENPKFKRPLIYQTIEEPTLLREMLLDDVFIFGGQFAILCQWAHPGLAKGSMRSNFKTRVANRLKTTLRFANAAIYGNNEEKEAIFSVIHKYHAPIHGDGYDANDPELHKWTAATLFVSFVAIHELVFGEMPREKMEAVFRQSAVYGTSLRMPPEMWPDTLDAFWEYWNHNIETLEITDEAKQLCQDLMYPINLPLDMAAGMPLGRLITANILPPRLAKEYNMEPTALSKTLFQTIMYGMSTVYPWLPSSLRHARHNRSMADLSEAVARIKNTGHWVGTGGA